ncbi:ABC transporter substrate-binding protein [Paenibacillus nasutitermitis]|uniref:Sugar ABC transporter substrate-binding protein n=1 Tax=Paenibacillus nasutitermitis TaxID=1652958 RepID=A0A916YIV9_9BACL|nr:sugar ABC transporter substrate-binding protein [Paenibacillus nasutitermitis]GGD46878.1 sugar ABC transporter substrate-binding protein [Paenibacillus nasutitermitis]
MQKAKKIGGMAIITCLILVLLAGCGGTKNDEGTNTGKGDENGNKGNQEAVTVKFSFWGGPEEKDAMLKLLDQFNSTHPGIHVEGVHIADDYLTKLNTMASSNTLPDLGYFPSGSLAVWQKGNKFADLTELYNSDRIGKKLDSVIFKNKDGSIIGAGVANEILLMNYNKELFDQANVPYPPASADQAWTWEQFVDAAKKLTTDRSGKHPGEDGFDANNIQTFGVNIQSLGQYYPAALFSSGTGVVSEDTSTITIGSSASVKALQSIADLMYKDQVMPKPSQMSTIPAEDTALLTKRIAMSISGQWSLQTLGKAVKEKKLQLGIGVLPKFETPVTTNFGEPVIIFNTDRTQKYKEQVEEVYAFIMNPEYSISLIENGLWMPNEEEWYKDEQLIKKWMDNPVHPPEYKTAVIDYGLNHTAQNPSYYWEDMEAFTIINPALDQLWQGKKTAEDVVKNDILPKLKKKYGDKYKYE